MRVIFFVTDLGRTGTPGYVEFVACGLASLGHEVIVVAEMAPSDRRASMNAQGVATTVLSAGGLSRRGVCGAVAQVLAAVRPDVAHVNVWRRRHEILEACASSAVPALVTVHSIPGRDEWWDRQTPLLRAKIAFARSRDRRADWRRGNYFIAVCEATRSAFLAEHGARFESRIATVNHGVRLRGPQAKGPSGAIQVLWVGSLGRRKAPLEAVTVVTAFRELPRGAGATLTLVGTGPMEAELRGMQLPWLRLLGQQEDAARLFPEYDVFLQTSWGEALSLAVVEAMAAGLPIVASDVGGTAEAVQHWVNGHIFEPGDWSSAARALQTLASSPGAWASMSHESRRLAAAKFSPERSLEDTLRSYEQALSLKRNGQR